MEVVAKWLAFRQWYLKIHFLWTAMFWVLIKISRKFDSWSLICNTSTLIQDNGWCVLHSIFWNTNVVKHTMYTTFSWTSLQQWSVVHTCKCDVSLKYNTKWLKYNTKCANFEIIPDLHLYKTCYGVLDFMIALATKKYAGYWFRCIILLNLLHANSVQRGQNMHSYLLHCSKLTWHW